MTKTKAEMIQEMKELHQALVIQGRRIYDIGMAKDDMSMATKGMNSVPSSICYILRVKSAQDKKTKAELQAALDAGMEFLNDMIEQENREFEMMYAG